jgi:transposase
MSIYIGLDISKSALDVCVLKSKEDYKTYKFSNDAKGHQLLLEVLSGLEVKLVVCEPTGGYEKSICQFLHQQGYPIHRVHTLAFHGFAQSLGLGKNDRLDAFKLAYYGLGMAPVPNFVQEDHQETLKDLVARREYLVGQLGNEKRNLSHKTGLIKDSIMDHIAYLEREIAKLNGQIGDHVQGNQEYAKKVEIACSVPGIGKVLAYKLLAFLPELGSQKLTLNELSAIVGIAPYCRDSGKKTGKRFIRGGRKTPRDALYVAVLTGGHKIPLVKALKERLIDKGKPKKVAIVACMRKVLAILHAAFKRNSEFLECL